MTLMRESKKASRFPSYAKPMSSGRLFELACHNLPPDFGQPRCGWKNGFAKLWLNPQRH